MRRSEFRGGSIRYTVSSSRRRGMILDVLIDIGDRHELDTRGTQGDDRYILKSNRLRIVTRTVANRSC